MQGDVYDKASFSVMCHTGAPLYSSIPTGEDLKKNKKEEEKAKSLRWKPGSCSLIGYFRFLMRVSIVK